MKQLGIIFKYYYGCNWALTLVPLLGLLILGIAMVLHLSTTMPSTTLFLWLMVALQLLMGVPFLCSAHNSRFLLAARSLALLPYFQRYIGLSLLLFTLVIAILPSLLASSLLPVSPPPLYLCALIFVCGSCYLGVVHWVLGSRVNITLLSYLMVAVALFMVRFGEDILHILLQPAMTAGAFMLSVAGWCYALHRLNTKRAFRLNSAQCGNARQDPWQSVTGFSMYNLGGSIATPAGTLALGYPDSLAAKFLRLAIGLIIIPAVNLIFMLSISSMEEKSTWLFLRTCMMISILFAMLTAFQYGEMTAQIRTLWLRFADDRRSLWQFIEYTLWQYLLLTGTILAGIALAIFSFTDLPTIHLLSFSMALIASVYAAYLALFCRTRNYKVIFVILTAISITAMMTATIFGLFNEGHLVQSYFPSLALQPAFLVLTFILRYRAKQGFSRIDWIQVKRSRKAPRDNLAYGS